MFAHLVRCPYGGEPEIDEETFAHAQRAGEECSVRERERERKVCALIVHEITNLECRRGLKLFHGGFKAHDRSPLYIMPCKSR